MHNKECDKCAQDGLDFNEYHEWLCEDCLYEEQKLKDTE